MSARAAMISAWLLAGLMAAPLAAELTPAQQRGKTIYLQGTRTDGGEIVALMGDDGIEVPASVVPCGGCHGADGRGRPEGGISPSNLTWPALTKPYGVDHPSGRRHPPYTDRLLERAITMGLDPAGNRLHVAMPRYRLSLRDADDLVAYVRQLGDDSDPGLADDSIAVGTLVPKDGPLASLGAAIEGVLEAYFDDLNRKGGVYGRRIELRAHAASGGAAERAAALREQLETRDLFALVGAFLPGAEAEIAAVVEELETPLIGPFTQHPQLGFPLNRFVFYLLPGLDDLGRALVGFAAADAGEEPLHTVVVVGSDRRLQTAAEAIAERVAELGWPTLEVVPANASDLEEELPRADRAFLLAGGDQQATFLRRAADRGWFPQVLVPGSLLGPGILDAPPGFAGRIVLAFPTLPSNQTTRSAEEYRRLAARYELPSRHLTAQITTLASAHVLVEGLKRAGRQLSRERLIEALEGFSEVDTGLTPLVTYGPNKRIGVEGAYMIALDLEKQELVPVGGWIASR